ncbi:MAG: DNA repair and recombination protein RadB [Candidatus Woesearchaeota archaeon]
MEEKITTGNEELDKALEGGYEKEIITTIYGPAGSGKSNLCLLCAVSASRMGKKVIFVDTESSFSIERLKQISPDHEKILENMMIFKPASFEEQKKVLLEIKKLNFDNIGLVIVDTIVMLYRVQRNKFDSYELNRDLGLQISNLSDLARKKNIPVILTSQVYSPMNGGNDIKIVGGDILNYASKCVIELQNFKNVHKLILKKHRSIGEKIIDYKITASGIEIIPR